MKIEFNPRGQGKRYLEALNQCFDGWGGKREFDWSFRRSFAGHMPDRLVISEGDEWIAGSAISWRLLADAGGNQRLIGIMTGSWTLPAARGRGCFKTIIEASRQRCVENGAAWLIAFVTAQNASRRALEAAGSQMIPSRYLWSSEDTLPVSRSAAIRTVLPSRDDLYRAWQQHAAAAAGRMGFHYPEYRQWADQFMHRALDTELLETEGGERMIVERHPVFDRLIATLAHGDEQGLRLGQASCQRAQANGRRFFTFSTVIEYAEELAARCGLGGTEGYITLLPAAEDKPDESTEWFAESGDRV